MKVSLHQMRHTKHANSKPTPSFKTIAGKAKTTAIFVEREFHPAQTRSTLPTE
jgi:hypothetical protein